MTITTRLKNVVEKVTSTHIYKDLPRGVDLFEDVKNDLPTFQADIVFDVGAHAGQSARKFLYCFPTSQIYCFEPAGRTFRQLQENLKGIERVHEFQLALGESKGKGRLLRHDSQAYRALPRGIDLSLMSRIDTLGGGSANDDLHAEEVCIETLDHFCREGNINQINYLKIDTEGGDVAVLKGADTMLSEHRIELVQVEAGMNSQNTWHAPFEALKELLESKRYFLFGVYEQIWEWPTKEPHLRVADLLFISQPMITANKS
jgi:FkbM family methyltransferase